ncbi:hypothetical protein CIW49_28290 [Mycolicibacterium sp. P1-18]|uniref:DUF5642 family protein n=1 Tax=Mycolicibacterium sp. P1-18 TaxID=2024615 RepID=UPI0011F2A491|nr:DUF5642 family protein [Mycolicibacterium sp. P1-18]KAA0092702.1 hypothetical protein CIW49_28290 [Mycolicibacterium sp. P1-18]
MRVFAWWLAIAWCVAACSPAAAPAPTSPPAASASFNPARVERVRADLPTGYEFTPLPARAEPVALWGLGPQWTADPPACAALGGTAAGAAVHGWSASGPGGIVYAVVADGPAAHDSATVDACGSWGLTAGGTSGVVTVVDPPVVAGAPTLGLSADVTTTVEGGTETHSHAETFVAYLGDHVAHVTVVTDPGSSAQALGPGFAADLLGKTVAAVRG